MWKNTRLWLGQKSFPTFEAIWCHRSPSGQSNRVDEERCLSNSYQENQMLWFIKGKHQRNKYHRRYKCYSSGTISCILLDRCYFGLETREIIEIESHCYSIRYLTDLNGDENKNLNYWIWDLMDYKNVISSNPPKFQELVFGLKRWIDAKSMAVAQPF